MEANGNISNAVVESIRRYYPATSEEPAEGYGRIVILEPGKPPFTLCSFLLDMEPEDILTLFWVKMKEYFPKAEQPG